jgi:hypothetical protein
MVGLWKNTQLWITRRHPFPDGSLLGGKQRVRRQDQGMPHPPPLAVQPTPPYRSRSVLLRLQQHVGVEAAVVAGVAGAAHLVHQ